MKTALFCIISLMILNVVNSCADRQMRQDTPKIIHHSYTM